MELLQIRDQIEKMTKFNQVEVLRILNTYDDITINENRYGIHVNLSDISSEAIDKLEKFIRYVQTQESALNKDEKEKEEIKNNHMKRLSNLHLLLLLQKSTIITTRRPNRQSLRRMRRIKSQLTLFQKLLTKNSHARLCKRR